MTGHRWIGASGRTELAVGASRLSLQAHVSSRPTLTQAAENTVPEAICPPMFPSQTEPYPLLSFSY